MKFLVCVMLLTVWLFGLQSVAMAHSNHDVISGQKALSVANRSVKQLTFKDFGFEVGKLDASWKELKIEDFSVAEVLHEGYIVKATNNANSDTIFFHIGANGQVLNVKNSHAF